LTDFNSLTKSLLLLLLLLSSKDYYKKALLSIVAAVLILYWWTILHLPSTLSRAINAVWDERMERVYRSVVRDSSKDQKLKHKLWRK